MNRIRTYAPMGLAILSLVAAAYYLYDSLNSKSYDMRNEMVSRWDERIQPLREALPADLHQVGYVDNSLILDDRSAFDVEEYFLMQYSVAPVAMQLGIEHEWIIGNFDKDSGYQSWLDAQIGTYEIQYFGFDLYLIRRLDLP